MPVSTRKFSELRLLVSDLLQTGDWAHLFDSIGTNDPELAKAVSGIFSMYEANHVWKFINYVTRLPIEIRRERRDSVAVACYTLGRIGGFDTEKSISALKTFLSDDHMLRAPVTASLSNLWVLDTKRTEKTLFRSWVLGGKDNDDLQEVSVRSSEYLFSQNPEALSQFASKVEKLDEEKFHKAREALRDLEQRYHVKKPRKAPNGKKRKRRARGKRSKKK